ncbi:GNAT family N-acetyltransferase, partial [Streptomyces sp. NPDC006367]
MELSWSLLHPVMFVPYLPTLGPLHPDVVSADLLDAITQVAGTGQFLPHDKDRRWSKRKDEHLLADGVHQDTRRTLIPTRTGRGILRTCATGLPTRGGDGSHRSGAVGRAARSSCWSG